MSITFSHHIRIRTEVRYPDGPVFDKFDYFAISDEELPTRWHTYRFEVPGADVLKDEFYDFLNNGGYWWSGWQEITPEIEAWIDSHPDAQGAQSEHAIEVEYI